MALKNRKRRICQLVYEGIKLKDIVSVNGFSSQVSKVLLSKTKVVLLGVHAGRKIASETLSGGRNKFWNIGADQSV